MTTSLYIEDTYLEFFQLCMLNPSLLNPQDWSACDSFNNQIVNGNKFTNNQANFLLKILYKYKTLSKRFGLDYEQQLLSPEWRYEFRTLDLSKQVFVEYVEDQIKICLKFPYSLKAVFDKEIDTTTNHGSSSWDPDRKLRILNFYSFNIIQLYEFCQNNGFDIDNSFLELVSQVEEIWQHQDSILCFASVVDDTVVLNNATESSLEYWEQNKTGHKEQDMFLAKNMGYPIRIANSSPTLVEKVCSNTNQLFWLDTTRKFFELYKTVGGITCILLDRNTKDIVKWLSDFIEVADQFVDRDIIKVCFRDESIKNSNLNVWIKEHSLGGKVDDGKILIFFHKPPKWLFTKSIDVKIIVTNSYTPHNEPLTTSWIAGHPSVFYVGDIKPTPPRNKKIVNV